MEDRDQKTAKYKGFKRFYRNGMADGKFVLICGRYFKRNSELQWTINISRNVKDNKYMPLCGKQNNAMI